MRMNDNSGSRTRRLPQVNIDKRRKMKFWRGNKEMSALEKKA
jgi:hypothetical protein